MVKYNLLFHKNSAKTATKLYIFILTSFDVKIKSNERIKESKRIYEILIHLTHIFNGQLNSL